MNNLSQKTAGKAAFPWWKPLSLVILVLLVFLYVTHASIPGSKVEGCGNGCATATRGSEAGLRVISLNMLHGFPLFIHLSERIDLIAAEIQRLDADVVLLQEVPWTIQTENVAQLLGKRLGFNYLSFRANGNKNLILFEQGEAILSRYDLTDPRFMAYTPRASYFDTRVVMGATVVTAWGRLDVYTTHLTNESLSVAGLQAEQLRNFVASHSNKTALVSGDFNSHENSTQIINLVQVWQDTYRVIHPDEPGYTCCIDDLQAQAEKPVNERIDYIFLANQPGEPWKVTTAEKVFNHAFGVNNSWQWASDHEGLMVEVQP